MTFNHYDIGSNPVNSSLTILSIILVEYNNRRVGTGRQADFRYWW